MYAIVKTGGKQYKVAPGDTLKVEKLALDEGQLVEFNDVLMVSDSKDQVTLGQPFVAGAKVTAEVVRHGRHKKVKILKFKRRKHHMKRMGHRQDFTEVTIKEIPA
jgi:large subunit ribosomal protein L21